MIKDVTNLSITCFFLVVTSSFSMAQEALTPLASPNAIVTMKYESTYVKITYCRPQIRNRSIFGGLIPYGKVWRTGANEATEITNTRAILIGGKMLKAGTYTLFSKPGPNEWEIILNSVTGQWGAYEYDPKFDVVKFTVPRMSTDVIYEPFTIEFEQKNKKTNLLLIWEKTKVAIPIVFL